MDAGYVQTSHFSILSKIQIPRLRSSLLILKDVYEEKDVRSYDNLEYEKKDMLKNDLTI